MNRKPSAEILKMVIDGVIRKNPIMKTKTYHLSFLEQKRHLTYVSEDFKYFFIESDNCVELVLMDMRESNEPDENGYLRLFGTTLKDVHYKIEDYFFEPSMNLREVLGIVSPFVQYLRECRNK